MCAPVIHPEIQQLQRQCRDLRGRIRAAVEEWHRLSSVERPRIAALYDRYFGMLERDYQRLAVQTAELFRRVELLSIKVARGERLTADIIDHVNRVVDKEYARFHRRIHQAFDMTAEQRNKEALDRAGQHDDDELVKTYRVLVKKLHPDAVGQTAEADPLWQQVQDAYASRNLQQMRSIVSMLEADVTNDQATHGWSVERLQREMGLLTSRLNMEERKLTRLRSSEPLSLAKQIEDRTWRDAHELDLRARLVAKQREYDETQRRYIEITGNATIPGVNPLQSVEERNEERDFMENTYFGAR